MASYDVFTPPDICQQMISYFPKKIKRLLEPSVGTGNLLSSMIGKYEIADVYDINQSYLDKIPQRDNINKYCKNFLTEKIDVQYDGIIMNPPYLRYQEMDKELRNIVRNISSLSNTGNIDLYISFIVKCIDLLSPNGILVAVIPTTWMYNKSCEKFRNFIFSNHYVHTIHDYGHTKIFPKIDVYCCILVLDKSEKMSYTKNNSVIKYETLQLNSLINKDVLSSISTIQNGIATLCDSVFIHDTKLFDEPCWKPILKVSKNRIRYIIFPYENSGNILAENIFQELNPNTYSYMYENKKRLENRDRGNKKYEAWYAYGRRQGLNVPTESHSVYVSTLCNPKHISFIKETMLFYSGIRIVPTESTCEKISGILLSNTDLIISKCSKRSNGWINITTSSLKDIPVIL